MFVYVKYSDLELIFTRLLIHYTKLKNIYSIFHKVALSNLPLHHTIYRANKLRV